MTENTHERGDKIEIVNVPRRTATTGYYPYIAYVYLSGVTSSVDDDGNDSEVCVGTDRHCYEIEGPTETAASNLATTIVADLVNNGVTATTPAPGVIRIDLDPDVDVGLLLTARIRVSRSGAPLKSVSK